MRGQAAEPGALEEPQQALRLSSFHLRLSWLSGATQTQYHFSRFCKAQPRLRLHLRASSPVWASWPLSFLVFFSHLASFTSCPFFFIKLSSLSLCLWYPCFSTDGFARNLSLGVGGCSPRVTTHCFPALSPPRVQPKVHWQAGSLWDSSFWSGFSQINKLGAAPPSLGV